MREGNLKLSLFGAAPDTGNLGVSALCYATIYNIIKQQPDAELTVFDHGRSKRQQILQFNSTKISFHKQGAFHSRRYYRPENLRSMQFLALFGGLGNQGLNTLRASDGILDISGGDSFTDLYGSQRFTSVILPKLLALQLKRPLVLLPQTYGPFATKKCRGKASELVKRARCAWARDERSFHVLRDLLGSSFDPAQHKCGVDVAFGLPTTRPTNLPQAFEHFLLEGEEELVGINISGLIYNDPTNTKGRFGFKADYNKAVLGLVRRFIEQTDCRVVLLPHVITTEGHYESDVCACRDVLARAGITQERVAIAPSYANPCEIKWVISKLKWFCGTRMHATIAALSSEVPVAAISYSPKTLGVFETCGQGDHVADPQKMDTEELQDHLWHSWTTRSESMLGYTQHLPKVMAQVTAQTEMFLASCGKNCE